MMVTPPVLSPRLSDIRDLDDLGIAFEVHFQSQLITLDDVEAVARLMRTLVEIVNDELRSRDFDPEVMLVTEVTVSGGSFKFLARLKKFSPTEWKPEHKTVAATILAALIGLGGRTVQPNPTPPPPPTPIVEQLSPACIDLTNEALREFDANIRKLPKSGNAKFTITCGAVKEQIEIKWDAKGGGSSKQ
jgi:hypothetical protein